MTPDEPSSAARDVAGACGTFSPRIGLVLAAGGERLVAWYTGILAGLADAGADLRTAHAVVGTSAGALVAAQLAAGVDPRPLARKLVRRPCPPVPAGGSEPSQSARLFAALAQLGASPMTPTERGRAIGRLAIDRSPGGDAAHVERVRRRLPDAGWPPALRIVALDAETGERIAFGPDAGAPLDRAVAAARSVPVMLPPVRIGGRAFIDGAVRSATNADLLADAGVDVAVIVTGSPEAATGLDALWNRVLDAELQILERAGVETVLVRATDADLEAMGPDPMSRATAPLAARAGRARAGTIAQRLATAFATTRAGDSCRRVR
jgi:NTE family protein